MSRHIDRQHAQTRSLLRCVGPLVFLAGLLLTVVGFASFFASIGDFGPPRYFWCAFVGLPLLALGAMICKFAFLGSIARYLANEVTPVGKDVTNYMATGTRGALRDVAAAVGQGLRKGMSADDQLTVSCPKCREPNDSDANYCKSCGSTLATSRRCAECGEPNAYDARYCDNCGQAIT